MNEKLIETAIEYSENGFSPIAVKEDKSPSHPWASCQKKHMINGEIQYHFNQPATKGIAIVCGAVSGNLEVIDIDLKYDTDNIVKNEFPKLLKESFPKLYDKLVVVETKNKGWHIPFKCEEIGGNQKLAKNKNGEVLIETRGEGGYVIAPPTKGYNSIKKSYSVIPTITKEERELLLSLARSFDETGKIDHENIYGFPEDDETTPFGDFNKHADIPKLVEENGWSKVNQQGDKMFYRRPGKEIGISANWETKKRIFYNFSTSTNFEVKGYSPTGVFTVLKCNGDFKTASRKLSELGYGKSKRNNHNKLSSTPPMPINGFPEFMQNFIKTCEKVYQTPRDFWVGSVIASTALAIGDKLELVTKYRNAPLLWICLVGDVSSGKTDAQEICLQPLSNLDAKLYQNYIDEIKEYKRLSRLSDAERLAEGYVFLNKPKRFQYIIKDYTPEAMAKVHSTNKRGLMISRDEIRGWFDDLNRYHKSGEESTMLSSFNRIDININRKNSDDIYIPKPFIALFGGLQPNMLPTIAINNREENGFLARFCFVYPENTKRPDYLNEILPKDLIEKYENFLTALTELQNKQELYLDKEAQRLYEIFYNNNSASINNEESGYLKGVFGKLDIIVLRIAIVIKGMKVILEDDKSNMISEEVMKSAIKITEYFRATALKVYHKIFFKDAIKTTTKDVVQYLYRNTHMNKQQIADKLNIHRQQVQRWTKFIVKDNNEDGTTSQ